MGVAFHSVVTQSKKMAAPEDAAKFREETSCKHDVAVSQAKLIKRTAWRKQ